MTGRQNSIDKTSCLPTAPGFFTPEVETAVVAKIREMAETARRALPR
jgi:hypothetical protein